MSRSLPRTLLRAVGTSLMLAALGIVAAGCATVRLERGPDSATVDRRAVGPPAIDAVSLARLRAGSAVLRIPTGTASPTPSFGPDGRRVALHTEAEDPEHDHRVHQVSVVDLLIGQIDIVHEWHQQAHTNTDPYRRIGGLDGGGGMVLGNPGGQVPGRDRTWHPVFFGATVLASVRATSGPFDTETTQRLTPGRDRTDGFGTRGSRPVVSPNGSRVLMQTHEGLAEFDIGGDLVTSHPGWEPVWAPDSGRFMSHLTPWRETSAGWWMPEIGKGWPEAVEPPSERRGGLVLHDGDEVRMLADAGGDPVWLPDGDRVIFWRPSAADPDAPELVEVRISDGERTVIAPGRAPTVHPSGVVVFEQADGLAALAPGSFGEWGAPVALEIDGSSPRFSPDGRWLMVMQPATGRESPARAVELAFWDLRTLVSDPDEVATPADDDQTSADDATTSSGRPAPHGSVRPVSNSHD